ncbi:transmembrane channel-like protein 7 isoform X2 [Gigantopelta aegis]|uniref:transmembrane channel-like protein 7 isoform X2 n=1 Tax=Gigantopelta aegis TaxID=1735272 RepID=UPI001B88BA76|nr:transmembrane channel-like protein 7 isoform X2 [Gigantopelta aegis]
MLSRNNQVSPTESIETISLHAEPSSGLAQNGHAEKHKTNIDRLKMFAVKYEKVNKVRGNKKVLYEELDAIFHGKVAPFRKTKPLSERKRDKIFSETVKKTGGCRAYKYYMRLSWRRFKLSCSEMKSRLEMWGSSLHWIEGHHGSGVLSYFVFLRWMFGLNMLLFVLLTGFLVVPRALLPTVDYSVSSTDSAVQLAYTCSAAYTINMTSSAKDLVLGFFQGTGWMEQTYMFYGYYAGIRLLDGTGTSYNYDYNLPLAYVVGSVACLLVCLIVMAKYTGKSFREAIVLDPESSFQYCNMVFASWDYAITDSKYARIAHKSIYYDIVSDIREDNFSQQRAETLADPCEKCKLYFVRILINFFVLACLGAAAYAIFYVTQWSSVYLNSNSGATGDMAYVVLLVEYLPSIVLTALNAAVPVIFDIIVLAEQYTQAFVIKLTLVRTVFLKLASIAVLVATLYSQITCSTKDACGVGTGSCTKIECWETHVGQQFYKLVIMNFFVTVLKVFYYEIPRRLATTKISCKLLVTIGPCQFNIAQNVLDLVYTQSLVWLGFFFAPMIAVLSVIHLFLVFYSKMLSALYACDPTDRPYRASRSNTFFMVVLLVTFFLCAFPVGYTIAVLAPSKSCGPFRTDDNMFTVINTAILAWPSWLNTIYTVATSSAIAGSIVVLLCLMVYYCSALSSAHKSNSFHLKEQLAMESKDKQFLLARIAELSGGSVKKTNTPAKTLNKPSMISTPAMSNGVKGTEETSFSIESEDLTSRSGRQKSGPAVGPVDSTNSSAPVKAPFEVDW